MSTQVLSLVLFVALVGSLLAFILVTVGRLRASPRLPFVAEQAVDLAREGSYALWLTGGMRGFWSRVLAEVFPDVRLVESATGGEITVSYPRFPIVIRGLGYYRQLATFTIERPGRYTLRIMGPATQSRGAAATGLILERRRK